MKGFKTKGYYFKSKNGKGANKHLYISFNEDGETVTVRNLDGETPPNIGMTINSHGGVFPLIKKTTPTSANFEQWQRWVRGLIAPQPKKNNEPREPRIIRVREKVFTTKFMKISYE